MPFIETYSVRFANGNLHPHVNLRGWPDMLVSAPTPDDQAQSFVDAWGRVLRITRIATAEGPARNNLYLVPPGGLTLDHRFFLRVTFDLPLAEGFSPAGELEPIPPMTLSPDVHGPLEGSIELPGSPGGPSGLSVPEPWAVVLSVSAATDLLGDRMVNLTCQFNRQFNGVRLNTPSDLLGIGALQKDKAACLEMPLDYSSYQGGYMAFPNGTDGFVEPPVFSLEHSFCGWNAGANGHTPGYGSLKIVRAKQFEVSDHRVFSSNALTAPAPVTSIGALGVSLVTLNGVGRMRVRLRTFTIWFNPAA